MSAPRYRCDGCGNLTRFDVTISQTTKAFHHYTRGRRPRGRGRAGAGPPRRRGRVPLVRPRAQRGRDHRRGAGGARRVVEGVVSEPPAEILRRLRPIPTYTDQPATTPARHRRRRRPTALPVPIEVVEAAAPVLLLFLSAACLGCRGPVGGPGRAAGRARPAPPASSWCTTRARASEDPDGHRGPGRRRAGTPRDRVVMSTEAFTGTTGSAARPSWSWSTRRRRAHRGRGLGRGARRCGPRSGAARRPSDRGARVTPCRMLSSTRGSRHADVQGHRQGIELQGHRHHGEPHRTTAEQQHHRSPRAGSPSTATAARCATPTACDDCVVSFLLGREPDDAVVIDADEARAMRMLERAGLVPTLRFSHAGRLNDADAWPGRRGEAPPPRHQRLPAQGRWDPELPLGPVAAARSRLLRRPDRVLRPGAAAFDADQAERGVRIERVPESILFFPTPGALAAVRRCVERARHRPRPVGPRPSARPPRPAPRRALRRDPPRGRGHRARTAARLAPRLARVLRGARLVVSAGGYPAAEGRRAAPAIAAPRGRDPARRSTPAPSSRSRRAERRAARARLGPARRRAAAWSA